MSKLTWCPPVGTWPVKDLEERELERQLEEIRREKRKRELRRAIAEEGGYIQPIAPGARYPRIAEKIRDRCYVDRYKSARERPVADWDVPMLAQPTKISAHSSTVIARRMAHEALRLN